MDGRILKKLSAITGEEREYLDGRETIARELYMGEKGDKIESEKLLDTGKLITIRPHTRFVHFPKHSHDYVEMVYMLSGETRHIVNGDEITLREGELLILGQDAVQEIFPAGEGDLAVNFIVKPEFFGGTLPYLGADDTPLRSFILACLSGGDNLGYLLFRVAGVKPIENLIENMLWAFLNETPNRRSIHQMTMGLLFVELMNLTDRLSVGEKSKENLLRVLTYIEEHYRDGSLTELAAALHYDTAWLSREIKRRSGKSYTELVQEKRLSQAAWLLRNTDENVSDVAYLAGYENMSYFHRIFHARFGMSPKEYRRCK